MVFYPKIPLKSGKISWLILCILPIWWPWRTSIWHSMIVLVCLRPFLAILILFNFCRAMHTPYTERDDRNMAKPSKIRQNTCFWHQNAKNRCQKVPETPVSCAPIIFLSCASDSSSNFGLKKCIHSISRKWRFLDPLTLFCRFENDQNGPCIL